MCSAEVAAPSEAVTFVPTLVAVLPALLFRQALLSTYFVCSQYPAATVHTVAAMSEQCCRVVEVAAGIDLSVTQEVLDSLVFVGQVGFGIVTVAVRNWFARSEVVVAVTLTVLVGFVSLLELLQVVVDMLPTTAVVASSVRHTDFATVLTAVGRTAVVEQVVVDIEVRIVAAPLELVPFVHQTQDVVGQLAAELVRLVAVCKALVF